MFLKCINKLKVFKIIRVSHKYKVYINNKQCNYCIMIIKEKNYKEPKWTASNSFGSSELTPRWERMNPINEIPETIKQIL